MPRSRGEYLPPRLRRRLLFCSRVRSAGAGRGTGSARIRVMPSPTQEQVTDTLRAVIDPELRRSIVDLGMVRSIEIRDGGKVEVVVSLTTAGCPIRNHFQQAVASNVTALDGVTEVGVG